MNSETGNSQDPCFMQNLRQIVDALPQIAWIMEINKSFFYFNQHWFNYTGYDSLVWNPIEDLKDTIHPDDLQKVIELFDSSLRRTDTFDIKYRLKGKEGQYRWYLGKFVPIKDSSGNVFSYFASNTEVDDQTGFGLTLQDKLLKNFVDAIPLVGWTADNVTNEMYYNSKWYEQFGYSRDEEIPEWSTLIHPEDLANCIKAHTKVSTTGELTRCDFRWRYADGNYRWLTGELFGTKDENGTVTRRIGVVKDIENWKHQKNLEEAQRTANIGSWEWDLITSSLTWSKQEYIIFGLDPSIPVSVDLYIKHISPASREKVLQVMKQILTEPIQSGVTEYSSEVEIIRSDGEVRLLLEKGNVEFDSSGKPIRMCGSTQDITESNVYEQKLRNAIEARDDFMSIASHELKTPLTALHMQLQLLNRLLSQKSKDESQESIRIAKLSEGAFLSVRQLSGLLDELLDATRVRVGKLSLKNLEVNLTATIIECVSSMQELAKQKGSTVTLKEEETVLGNWDQSRITQVISNLLSNAIKYGEGKPIEISVSTDKILGKVRLRIKDHGMGISNEMQLKIFERFQRGISGKKVTGLGLGLYIVRQIIEAHGGSIWVESELGKGSLFIVELPLVGVEQSDE
ncbi:MAG: PAS domain-containing protein [Bdellovibrionia bacterium]